MEIINLACLYLICGASGWILGGYIGRGENVSNAWMVGLIMLCANAAVWTR